MCILDVARAAGKDGVDEWHEKCLSRAAGAGIVVRWVMDSGRC